MIGIEKPRSTGAPAFAEDDSFVWSRTIRVMRAKRSNPFRGITIDGLLRRKALLAMRGSPRPSLTRLGILDVELAIRARNHKIM